MPPPSAVNEELLAIHTEAELYPALLSRISWGAILAGALCALATQLFLTIVGVSLGFTVVDPAQDQQPLQGLATATGVFWVISSMIALFIGGWIAARLAGIPRSVTGALHGATVWALAALFSAWLAFAGVTKAMGGATAALLRAGQIVGQTTQAVLPDDLPNVDVSVQTLNSLLPGVDLQRRLGILQAYEGQQRTQRDIREQAREIVRQVVSRQEQAAATQAAQQTARDIITSPGNAGRDIERLLDRLFGGPNAVFDQEDRQELVNVLQNRLNLSAEEAERVVQNWQTQYQNATQTLRQEWQQAQQEATQLAQTATDALATVSAWTAFALLLGLAAALIGGLMGRPEEVGVFWPPWRRREDVS